MFQTQVRITEQDSMPPFLKNADGFKEITLLQNTLRCKDGRRRLPTPDKMAIMELSTSFQKRRLGKQQRILTDITRRCREQDVNDLSSVLSSKCTIKQAEKQQIPKENSSKLFLNSRRPLSDPSQNNRVEATYKSFPVRKIFKRIRNEYQRDPLVRSKTSLLPSDLPTRRSVRAQTECHNGKGRHNMWAVPMAYSKPQDQIIFCASHIEPEPRTKSIDRNSVSTRSLKSSKEIHMDQSPGPEETASEGRQQ